MLSFHRAYPIVRIQSFDSIVCIPLCARQVDLILLRACDEVCSSLLWVGCYCGSVVAGRLLWVDCCGSIFVGRLLSVGRRGLAIVGRLL